MGALSLTYVYRADTADNTRIGGSMKAASEKDVLNRLTGSGLGNISVFASKTSYSAKPYKRVSARELSIFCRQLSVLFLSQITLVEGVLMLAEQTDNKELKTMLSEVYEHMCSGTTFAESVCMYPHICGSYLISMLTIGEQSGTLDEVLMKMASYFEKEDRVRRKLRSAVTYPAVLSVLMLAIILFLILRILPMFNNLLDSMGADASPFTNVILAVSLFVSRYLWLFAGAIAVIAFLATVFLHSGKGKKWLDRFKLTFVGVKYVYTRMVTAKTARSLAILLKSGVQLLNALDQTVEVIDNRYLSDSFKTVIDRVRNGEKLADSMKSIKSFPVLFIKMLTIGESTGRLDDMLDRSAGIFESEVDESIEKLTSMIEPALIIVLSVIVGIILVSVMLPMISIMNSIG